MTNLATCKHCGESMTARHANGSAKTFCGSRCNTSGDMTPIKPENRERYGPDWKHFSDQIRFVRARHQCECEGECGMPAHVASGGRCINMHGQTTVYGAMTSIVILTVAHLCHTPECREHVKAMCQGCHLNYDREHHAETRAATRRAAQLEAGQEELPL